MSEKERPISLTDRQTEVLRYIVASIKVLHRPPTFREIAAHIEVSSTNGIKDHLAALERKGAILRSPFKHRCIIVTDAGMSVVTRGEQQT